MVNSDAMAIIQKCEAWYANALDGEFHKRKNLNNKDIELLRMNFAKRCCADDANLCEVISVSPERESASSEFIEKFLGSNRFPVMYRKQLEKTSATGTVGAYIYLKGAEYLEENGVQKIRGGDVKINYVPEADCIIPLSVDDDLIEECAFSGTERKNGIERTTLVIFTKPDGRYKAETIVFDELGRNIENERSEVQLGDVKPFAIMQNAEVNNIKEMSGYGLPKIYNTIPLFKALDLCFTLLYGDLDKGEKVVFLNELLACLQKKTDGTEVLTPQQKDLFVLLGEKLPQADTLIKEYNPEIRVEQITKAFELILSLLSMSFGYGSKKYTFENGRITTATEYIGEKQDCMQELNKQRTNASDYIKDIIRAAMWFSNTFCSTAYNLEEELLIQFDDSYIEDRVSKLESMRADALSFAEIPMLKIRYLMEKYNLPEEEAKKWLQNTEEEIDDLED